MATKIYVKGWEKKKWLESLIDRECITIIDMNDLNCTKIEKLIDKSTSKTCLIHSRKKEIFTCALQNVIVLKNWLCKNYTT